MLLNYLSSNPAVINARRIPLCERDDFLRKIITASRQDYNLDEEANAGDIAKLYQAFELKEGVTDFESLPVWQKIPEELKEDLKRSAYLRMGIFVLALLENLRPS